ncbi:hypothetical protein [Brachybacterium paraconglomeratum]|uniref:hypothetical protein n=1 Tax=Brachybacterium paraconglomeratum TaxID=173362 RepID=UPI003FCF7DC6
MDHTTPQDNGDRPGGDAPLPGAASASARTSGSTGGSVAAGGSAAVESPAAVDVLGRATARLAGLDADPSARAVLSEIVASTLHAFTRTRSTRDPLPDTAPGSAEEALAVLAGLDHLRSALAALDASWQVRAEQRITQADAAHDVPASRRGKGASHEISLARRVSPSSGSYSSPQRAGSSGSCPARPRCCAAAGSPRSRPRRSRPRSTARPRRPVHGSTG